MEVGALHQDREAEMPSVCSNWTARGTQIARESVSKELSHSSHTACGVELVELGQANIRPSLPPTNPGSLAQFAVNKLCEKVTRRQPKKRIQHEAMRQQR